MIINRIRLADGSYSEMVDVTPRRLETHRFEHFVTSSLGRSRRGVLRSHGYGLMFEVTLYPENCPIEPLYFDEKDALYPRAEFLSNVHRAYLKREWGASQELHGL